jgi:hypothetical protein
MNSYEHRSYAFLLKDVMKNNFNYGYDQEELWNYVKDKEEKEYNIKDVKHWIYHPCWSYDLENILCFYSIYQVLIQKDKFREEIKRIKKADVSYPLIITEDDYDKYGSILDGNHRFAKLIMNKSKKVKIKFLTKKELEKFRIKLT